MSFDLKGKGSKPVLMAVGLCVLVVGMTLVLVWWADVVRIFKGISGMVLALGGLLILYLVKE